MFAHYTRLAIKVLWRRRFFTFISLFAITFTLSVLMVVSTVVDNALSPMAPETKLDRTLHISHVWLVGEQSRSTGSPGYGFLDRYCRDLPGVEEFTIYSEPEDVTSYVDGEKIVSSKRHTDGEYWETLDYDFIEGAPYTADDERAGNFVAVINRTTRQRFFAGQRCVGKMIEADGQRFRVVGVVEDVPLVRTSAAAEMWVPISTTRSTTYKSELRGSFQALLVARSRADFAAIRDEFASRLDRVQFPDDRYNKMRGVPMTRIEQVANQSVWSFEPDKPKTAQLTFSVLGATLIFMLLPTINLININTSRIFERASEIGVRKAFGASSSLLVGQFVFENVILCLVGGALAFAVGATALELIRDSNVIPYGSFQVNYRVFAYAFLLAVFFGCLSGVYPAWRMSRMHPVQALREDVR